MTTAAMVRRSGLLGLVLFLGLLCWLPLHGQPAAEKPATGPLGDEWRRALTWRSIGPANMGGRITALAVCAAEPSTYYVGTATGGLLKTVNNGITFEHQFDRQKVVSIGDVCVAPSNQDIVWVGTGENNPRNSVSYGDGVYKSSDGGKSWQHMGLKETFQIGRILIHPNNPDIVYVGALGRLYGPNPERGLYKTVDGGKTWDKILFVDDKTGVIDMRMHPQNPDVLLVAMWERRRDSFDGNDPEVKWGRGSGLFKTTDGGKTFRRLTAGLPASPLGRIGLDWYSKDPSIVYMVLDCDKIGMVPKDVQVSAAFLGVSGETAKDGGARLRSVVKDSPAEKAGLQVDDVVKEWGGKEIQTYQDLTEGIRSHKEGTRITATVQRAMKTLTLRVTLGKRAEAEEGRPLSAYLGGQRENVQKKQGKDGYQYGGVYKSTDGGESWQRINSLNPRPMYFSQIRVDPQDAHYVYVLGIALHRSTDGGQTFKNDGGETVHADHHALWIDPHNGRHMVLGTDGGVYVTYDRMNRWDHLNFLALGQFYHVAIDPRPHYKVYGGLQDNGTWGGPAFTKNSDGPRNADWVRVGGGDGFRCQVDVNDPDVVYYTSQWGRMARRDFRTGEVEAIRPPKKKGISYRFNWNTPFLLSSHNSRIFYAAGNYVFKSLDRGDDLSLLSPEITRTDKGSASALAESPRDPHVLYVGTDDGNLWLTRDGGRQWDNITKNVGLPGPFWVASIEASRYADGRAYVVFDAHRSDDMEPYVYVTEDFGKTWQELRGNLPWGSTRVLREDIQNKDLLYLGTEFGLWCSLDRGRSWTSMNTNLPTVPVLEVAQHPTSGELIAATHGRSLWVLPVTPLRQMAGTAFPTEARLYKTTPVIRWISEPTRGGTLREFSGQNHPRAARIFYSLPQKADKLALKIVDVDGELVHTLKTINTPGLHYTDWNLTRRVPSQEEAANKKRAREQPQYRPVAAGTYRAVLTVDGREFHESVRVLADPALPLSLLVEDEQPWPEQDEDDEEEEERDFAD